MVSVGSGLMAAQVFLLGLCSAYTPGNQPPKAGVRTPTTAAASPPPADIAMATQQAVAGVAEKSQNLVASLFEWEHERAAKYERYGPTPYWSDPRIHNFGNTGLRGFLHALVVPIAAGLHNECGRDTTGGRERADAVERGEALECVSRGDGSKEEGRKEVREEHEGGGRDPKEDQGAPVIR